MSATIPATVIIEVIVSLIDMAKKLAERAHQEGVLTAEQKVQLLARAGGLFAQFEDAPPPPKKEG